MGKTSLRIVLACCVFATALLAVAQAGRKPGLYEITTRMTWQQSPFPSMPGMPDMSAAMSAPHAAQVCLTQQMIDKYGGPLPQSRNNECHASNVKITGTGMTADWVCTGSMNGTGTVQSSWTDENHTTSKVHFTGTMQMGRDGAKPVEWTSDSISVYKGADCGSVKPIPMDK